MSSKYPHENFYALIAHQGKTIPNRVAFIINEEKITYKELLNRIDAFAGYLEYLGVQKEDRIGLFLRNSIEFVISIFAINKVGAIAVPINIFLKASELGYILNNANIKILIGSTLYKDTIKEIQTQLALVIWEGEDIERVDEHNSDFTQTLKRNLSVKQTPTALDDTFVFIYTSGTTGKPKGVMLSNKNIFSNILAGIDRIEVTHKDTAIIFLPMFHSFTFSIGLLLPLFVGAKNVIIPSIKPFSNIFKQTLLKRVTLFLGIPDVYNALAKAKLPWYFRWFNSIRVFVSGAAPLHEKTLRAMNQKFKGAVLLEGYGLSEASPAVSINSIEKQKVSSVGLPLKGYEVKIVDDEMSEVATKEVGNIIIKGDNVMQGYFNHESATDETLVNGWLLSGDMGYLDEEGYLFLVDRKKDMIISKGINIYPREIEDALSHFKGIKASAVIGIKQEEYGEIPEAYVELDEGIETIDIKALKKYLKEHLADYKLPKNIHIIDELPKNATGKVLKRVLKEHLEKL
jgi:long-chain acyl-CoA synthetase